MQRKLPSRLSAEPQGTRARQGLVATLAERGGTAGIPAAIEARSQRIQTGCHPKSAEPCQLAAVIGKVFWEGGLHGTGAAGEVTEHLEALKQKELLRTHPRRRCTMTASMPSARRMTSSAMWPMRRSRGPTGAAPPSPGWLD